ncbi:MAG: hypothetical protein ACD_46C00664G0002, partial [uncultured bacterium]
AEKARELGAAQVTLIAPYLAYMRQDKAFHVGEGVSAKYFAKLLSSYFDRLITLSPHLHRIHHLAAIYTIPTTVLHVTDHIAQWINQSLTHPLLIGPDEESEQWVKCIAEKVHAPYIILQKERLSDNTVSAVMPNIDRHRSLTPILIDDIISTAQTMIAVVKQIKPLQMAPPVCIGVHAVFAENAYQQLLAAGAAKIVTCNTIQHLSNAIDVSDVIARAIMG